MIPAIPSKLANVDTWSSGLAPPACHASKSANGTVMKSAVVSTSANLCQQ